MLLLVKDDDLCWFIKYFVFLIVFTAWQVITWCIERLAVMHMDRGVWHIFSIITAAWWKTTFSIMFQSSMRGIINISKGCKTFWQSQNIPLDKQITFLQIKPEAIIISASNELINSCIFMFYEDRSVITGNERKHTEDSHQFIIARPVVQWWNCKMIVFLCCVLFSI